MDSTVHDTDNTDVSIRQIIPTFEICVFFICLYKNGSCLVDISERNLKIKRPIFNTHDTYGNALFPKAYIDL